MASRTARSDETNEKRDLRVRVLGEPVDAYPEVPPEVARGTIRRITVVGEPILHRPCRKITEFGTPELAALIDDMFATMYGAEGVGLAANQMDVDAALFVYDCTDEDGVRHVGHLVNPELEESDPAERRLVKGEEGCLSVPGAYMEVARLERAAVHGQDSTGAPVRLEGTGYFARCLQHETDHLYGGLYLDRLSSRGRKKALKEMAERAEEVFARRTEVAETLGR
ncbi:peptide deformylase [Frankia torreyi]|uniref:Peptide deformylase n=1 Tax=Frankia torreyi TaxID=1856 RepID=A0A0D8B579_9ACTN|nr:MULTISPECIES: peptide deformylase [Frankia]KJE19448.1 peptide deformylase [Frankia torreyi]KQC40343.1 peptide deformylase [Frankia sp. ACN1ag]KQM01887.1 peptide deformylase [Frankia sp. CpI1-P]